MAKVRVYELAKEFGVESKAVMAKLQEMGEFVRSASSTIEAPVVRRLKEAFAGQAATAKASAEQASADGGRRAANGRAAAAAAPVAEPAAPAQPVAQETEQARPAAAAPPGAGQPAGPGERAAGPAEPQRPDDGQRCDLGCAAGAVLAARAGHGGGREAGRH